MSSPRSPVMVPHPPLIIPEVGKGEEKAISSTISAYQEAARQVAACHPGYAGHLVSARAHVCGLLSSFSGVLLLPGIFGNFGAPQVRISAAYDTAFVPHLVGTGRRERGSRRGRWEERRRWLDHGTMIPAVVLEPAGRDLSHRAHRSFWSIAFDALPAGAQCIQETARKLGRTIAVIASGDLSASAEGRGGLMDSARKDQNMISASWPSWEKRNSENCFPSASVSCAQAGECGHRAFVIMAGALDAAEISARQLSYEGPFGVGYGRLRSTGVKAMTLSGIFCVSTRRSREQKPQDGKARRMHM